MDDALVSLLRQLKGFWPYLLPLIPAFVLIQFNIAYYFSVKNSKILKLPPGPKPWPIAGNLPEMLVNKPAFKWIHNLMKQMDTEIICIRLGNVHVVPITCPNIACEILKKQDSTFASRPLTMATNLISGGYLTTTFPPYGNHWKKMKKILSHDLLSTVKHKSFQGKRNEEIDNLVFYVYNKCKSSGGGVSDDSSLVNVRTAARHYCCSVLMKLIFNTRYFGKGRDDGGPGYEEKEYTHAIFTLLEHCYAFSVSDYMPFLSGLDLDGHQRMVNDALRVVNKYNDPIIQQRIEKWNNAPTTTADADDDMLDILLSLKDSNNKPLLTLKEIKAQIIELMIGGLDNPSNAVECALAEMVNHPDLLRRATEELDNVVGTQRLVQESDIPKLNYVKACARESFRLHPIAPFNPPHVSMNDAVVGDYFIPKGSHILLSRQGLGRNPKVWNEPHKFNPERHLKNDGSMVVLAEPDLNFISFSTGRRGCPAVTLGTTMTVMLLARLIHGFTWSLPPNVSGINLAQSNNGMLLAEPVVLVAKPRLLRSCQRIPT